ncbi:MAG: hypothetical protein CMJ64_27130 [Planctomycetaceae bacterium]|nr:hypothetical protein [Planctomycetaceae bacterium]
MSHYMALAIACRIGDISRFPSPRSLANFFGLTPSRICSSSQSIRRLRAGTPSALIG